MLAGYILKKHTHNHSPLALADITIWLPTQRAVKALRDAFVAKAGDGLVIPKLKALRLGEGEGEPLLFDEQIDTTPTMPELARLLYLMRQVRAKDSRLSMTQAFDNTQSLAALFDRLMQYDVSFEALTDLVPTDMASHWEQNLLFLKIVFEFYPHWLMEQGKVDGATKRRQLLQIQAEKYLNDQTGSPVYAAGFADTTPAGRAVLQAILASPAGTLVLPSVDVNKLPLLDKPLPPTHPHAATAGLVQALGVDVKTIEVLGEAPARATLWQQALCPPDGVELWQAPIDESALSGLNLVEAPNDRVEADVIAHLMREVLETPHKTCALVTPSRELGQRVADRLKGWGVYVNDSAGVPLRQCPAGSFFSQLADVVAGRFRPLATAELIRHPFANFGMTKKEWRKRASALEGLVLRGPRPNRGLHGLKYRLEEALTERHNRPNAPHEYLNKQAELAREALSLLEQMAEPFMAIKADAPLSVWVDAHLKAAQMVAMRADGTGGDVFLREADGESLTTLLDEWRRTESHGLKFSADDYANWTGTIFDRTAVRLKYRQHPRLFIWGSPESRLQAVDRVIIGGCNEGGWPRMPSPDPWLNRDMLAALNLPDPEAQVGLNAQDFLHLACLPEVYLTRAVKKDGAEAVPARYLSRLEGRLTAVDKTAFNKLRDKGRIWLHTIDKLYTQPLPEPIAPAEVAVKPEHLPKTWSASTVRDLMQCPYRTYASKVLKLDKLPAFEEPPDASERGNLLHLCLHAFFEQQDGLPPPFGVPVTHANKADAEKHLLHIGDVVFGRLSSQTVRAVWWPRFCRMAAAFVVVQADQQKQGRVPHAFEVANQLPMGDITLFARADRIDKTPDGYVVMDYKTGTIPTKTNVRMGREPQLALELLLMESQNKTPIGAEYWNVATSRAAFDIEASPSIKAAEVADLMDEAKDGLAALRTHFMEDKNPMQAIPGGSSALKPEGLCRYCDFAGVCRMSEWQN